MSRLKLGDFSYEPQGLRLGQLRGNLFRLVLRGISDADVGLIDAAVTQLKASGFVNYFGLQRFGTHQIHTHSIGISLLCGEWERACKQLLAPRPGENAEILAARNRFITDGGSAAAAILNKFPQWMSTERSILESLKKKGSSSWLPAIESVPRNMRLMYLHAYQSLVWNNMASLRLERFGKSVVVGDLVLQAAEDPTAEIDGDGGEADDQNPFYQPSHLQRLAEQVVEVTDDNIELFHITDVVLPLPGFAVRYPTHAIGEAYKDLLGTHGIDIANMKRKQKFVSLPGDYRRLVVVPRDVEWDVVRYEGKNDELQVTDLDMLRSARPWPSSIDGAPYIGLRLQFMLGSSQYATMCMRQLLKDHLDEAFKKELPTFDVSATTCSTMEASAAVEASGLQ